MLIKVFDIWFDPTGCLLERNIKTYVSNGVIWDRKIQTIIHVASGEQIRVMGEPDAVAEKINRKIKEAL